MASSEKWDFDAPMVSEFSDVDNGEDETETDEYFGEYIYPSARPSSPSLFRYQQFFFVLPTRFTRHQSLPHE